MSLVLETALSHWSAIRPQPFHSPHPFETQKLLCWIDGDVCRVFEELKCRADFRERARAPIDRLCCGTQTQEGQLIAQIDSVLVRIATNLVEFLMGLMARREFSDWRCATPTPVSAFGHPQISGLISLQGSSSVTESFRAMQTPARRTPEIDCLIEGLRHIAGRPWIALTSVNDYFSPSAGLNLTAVERERERGLNGGRPPRMRELSHDFQPYLEFPGDFIFNCFEGRVEFWKTKLVEHGRRILTLLQQCPVVTEDDDQAFQDAWCFLQPLVDQLRRHWQESPDAAERLAALRLVQIRAAFHPERTLDWLPEAVPFVRNAVVFRERIEMCGNRQIAQYVADALSTLSEMYNRQDDVDLQIQNYAENYPLCVIEGRLRREVYWQGELLGIDWHRHDRAWILFSSMALTAKQTGQGVDSEMFHGLSLRDAKRDLCRFLPKDLSSLIEGTPSRALRLAVPSAKIHYASFCEYELLEAL